MYQTEENMEQPKQNLIAFIGLERCDMVFILSEVLHLSRKNSLIIDNSIDGDLFSIIAEKDVEVADRGRCEFIRMVDYSPEVFCEYDHVIAYEGFNPSYEILENADTIYAVTDYNYTRISRLSEILANISEEKRKTTMIILRDKQQQKRSDKDIIRLLENTDIHHCIGSIPVSRMDNIRYENFTHDKKLSVKGMSSEFKEIITYIVARTLQKTEKQARKLLRKV